MSVLHRPVAKLATLMPSISAPPPSLANSLGSIPYSLQVSGLASALPLQCLLNGMGRMRAAWQQHRAAWASCGLHRTHEKNLQLFGENSLVACTTATPLLRKICFFMQLQQLFCEKGLLNSWTALDGTFACLEAPQPRAQPAGQALSTSHALVLSGCQMRHPKTLHPSQYPSYSAACLHHQTQPPAGLLLRGRGCHGQQILL